MAGCARAPGAAADRLGLVVEDCSRWRRVGGKVAAAEIKDDIGIGLNHPPREIGTLIRALNVALAAQGASAAPVALDLTSVAGITGWFFAGVRHHRTVNL